MSTDFLQKISNLKKRLDNFRGRFVLMIVNIKKEAGSPAEDCPQGKRGFIMADYHDMKVCDLRFIRTVEEARAITSIHDVELLVLPNDAPPDVTQALAGIPKNDIKNVIQLGSQEELDLSKYFKKSVSYKDVNVLDLRSITTLEAANSITEMKNIGTLILPSDAPAEIQNALALIPQKSVKNVLYKPVGEELDFSQMGSCGETEGRIVYNNMEVVDLRPFKEPAALEKIDEINNVELLVIPSNASGEVQAAIAGIPKNRIGRILSLEDDLDISIQNVNGLHTMNTIPKKVTLLTVNGACIIPDLAINEDTPAIYLCVNGICLIHKNLKKYPSLECTVNGLTLYKEFDQDAVKAAVNLELNAEAVSYLMEDAVLMVGNNLRFAEDVTPQMLLDKKVSIVAGNKITAPKHLIPYLSATATVGDKIVALEG